MAADGSGPQLTPRVPLAWRPTVSSGLLNSWTVRRWQVYMWLKISLSVSRCLWGHLQWSKAWSAPHMNSNPQRLNRKVPLLHSWVWDMLSIHQKHKPHHQLLCLTTSVSVWSGLVEIIVVDRYPEGIFTYWRWLWLGLNCICYSNAQLCITLLLH